MLAKSLCNLVTFIAQIRGYGTGMWTCEEPRIALGRTVPIPAEAQRPAARALLYNTIYHIQFDRKQLHFAHYEL